jgi:uncharacterized protein YbaR (Trm112 family)/SAM-dependent methyltransferase
VTAAAVPRYQRLLPILACPACGGSLVGLPDPAGLRCTSCNASYAVEHGVPILLTETSRRLLGSGHVSSESPPDRPWVARHVPERIRACWRTSRGEDPRQQTRLTIFVNKAAQGDLIVDLGSGSRRLADHVLTVDVCAFPGVDLVGDGHRLPFRSDSLAGIVCTGVLEHVDFPERVVTEMARVLRPGGRLYVATPFLQGFHPGSGTEQDFQRYTHVGLLRLLAGFRVVESGMSGGPGLALAWMLREYLALPFGWSRTAYAIAHRVAGIATFWLRWFDVALERAPQAERIACGFYVVGEKPHAGASGGAGP